MPFSIEQLLNEIIKIGKTKANKLVYLFLDDNNYLNQRKLIFADTLERKNIISLINRLRN